MASADGDSIEVDDMDMEQTGKRSKLKFFKNVSVIFKYFFK